MKCKASYSGLLVLLVTIEFVLAEDPEVNTNFGLVRGTWFWTAKALEVAGFLGIPYAEPPIGDLRFEVMASYQYSKLYILNNILPNGDK
jgi:hypothetical protein